MELTDKEKTVVYVNKEQAALFVLFMENYHNFAFMTASGCWNVYGGNVTLNIDKKGIIQSIKTETFTHRA